MRRRGRGGPVAQLRERHAALRWWRDAMSQHPGGIVPVHTVASILGVQPSRVWKLIAEGRFTLLELPGGSRLDRFVPADELMDAPFRLNVGRPGLYGPLARKKFSSVRKNPKPGDLKGLRQK